MKNLAVALAVAGLIAFGNKPANAGAYVSTDRCSYTGDTTRYASLTDAQAEINPLGVPWGLPDRDADPPDDTPHRDSGFYFVHDVASYGSNANELLTAWYYMAVGDNPPNPNNTTSGFLQIVDDDSSTDTSFAGYFSADLSSFTLRVSGENATSADDLANFWNAPEAQDHPGATAGIWHSYELDVTFSGLANAAWNSAENIYEAFGHPTSVSGTFTGIFENTNDVDNSYQGFYRVGLTFGMDSWAFRQLEAGNLDEGYLEFYASEFGGPAIAEPCTLLLVGSALIGFLGVMRRRA